MCKREGAGDVENLYTDRLGIVHVAVMRGNTFIKD